MFHFDLAEIVLSQEEAPSGRRGARDDVVLPLQHHAAQGRIRPQQKRHFTFQISGEAQSAAAQGRAFRADVVQSAIRKGAENGIGSVAHRFESVT